MNKNNGGFSFWTRLIALILAILMVLSVAAYAITSLF